MAVIFPAGTAYRKKFLTKRNKILCDMKTICKKNYVNSPYVAWNSYKSRDDKRKIQV